MHNSFALKACKHLNILLYVTSSGSGIRNRMSALIVYDDSPASSNLYFTPRSSKR